MKPPVISSSASPVEPVPVDPVDLRDPVDPMDPMDPVDLMDPVDIMGIVDPMDPVDPLDPMDPVDPMVPMDPVDPMGPLDPLDLIDPIDPLDPVNPLDPFLWSLCFSFKNVGQFFIFLMTGTLSLTSSTEVKERVELYLCSLSGPSWPCRVNFTFL